MSFASHKTDLRQKIISNMENPASKTLSFATKVKLKEIIKREDIEATLQGAGLEGQTMSDLTDFIIDVDKFQIFATLVVMENPQLIVTFKESWDRGDVEVLELPIEYTYRSDGRLQPVQGKIDDMFRSSGSRWSDGNIETFCEQAQWKFSAPTFEKDTFRYEFKHGAVLPFTSRSDLGGTQAGSAYIEKVTVHKDHITLRPDQSPCFDEEGNPTLVLKTLNPSTEIGKKAKKEAKNLEDVRRLRSDRLIKAVAYFQLHTASRTKHCFLFPFAKYGNLWYFWAKGSKELEKEGGLVHRGHNSYLVWVFSQLIEMADALVELHKPDPNIRHGDLKPENILCFQDDHSAERAPPIRLVITDVGISKGHKNKTEARAVTSTEVSTTRYEPPEMELTIQDHSKLSRRYDVWSMGCIFLEFLFWLLYDFKELLKFTQAFSDGRFYSKADKKPARVRSEVKHWMSRIKNDKKSCPPHTPLWRLVSLIEEKLLVVRVETLEASQNAATEAPTQGSLLSRWLGRKEKPRREITQQATSFIGGLKHSPGRVSAQEMSEELKEILNDIQARGFEVNRASG